MTSNWFTGPAGWLRNWMFPGRSDERSSSSGKLTIGSIGLKILALNVGLTSLFPVVNLLKAITPPDPNSTVALYHLFLTVVLGVCALAIWSVSNHWPYFDTPHKIAVLLPGVLILTYLLFVPLMEHGAITENMRSLRESIESGNVQKSQNLIEDGTKIIHLGDEFPSLLHLAAKQGALRTVGLMLRQDVDYTLRSPYYDNKTSLQLAVKNQRKPVARLLLIYGADPTRRNGYGRSALGHAVRTGNADMVDLLLQQAEDDHTSNKGLEDLVEFASRQGRNDIARRLRSHSSAADD